MTLGDTTVGDTTVIVGGYTKEAEGSAEGLIAYRVEATGDPIDIREFPVLEADSPTYIVTHPNQRWFYAVTETDESAIVFFQVERDALRSTGSTPTGAGGACHLAVTSDGDHLIVAHYVDGLVTSHRIGPNGVPGPTLDTHHFAGSGPNLERQSMSHAHQVVPFGSEVLVSDLGTDRIHRLAIDRAGRFIVPGSPIQLPPGSGPRHLVVDSGDRLLVVCELSAQLVLMRHDGREWLIRDSVDTTVSDGPCQPSAIRLQGDDIFVANRGPDSFAVIDLDRDSDELTLLTEVPTGGRWPRDLIVQNGQVWVACQESDLISVFRTATEGASPELEWILDFQISSPSPACLIVRGPALR